MKYRYVFKLKTPMCILTYDIVAGSFVEAAQVLRRDHPETAKYDFTAVRQTILEAKPALRREVD